MKIWPALEMFPSHPHPESVLFKSLTFTMPSYIILSHMHARVSSLSMMELFQ